MDENLQKWLTSLENAWAENGFLWKVREGNFDDQQGEEFINFLRNIEIRTEQMLSRRFVSLIWYVPLFLTWQTERVIEMGGDRALYEQFNNRVLEVVENILGVP